jgi:hypothetical protein
MAKPYNVPGYGYASSEPPYKFVHPFNYKGGQIDEKIPSYLKKERDTLIEIRNDLERIAGGFFNSEDVWFQALVRLRGDWEKGLISSHSYYTSSVRGEKIPELIYDYIVGCQLVDWQWNPKTIFEYQEKCEKAKKEGDDINKKKYCVIESKDFDMAIAELYEQDCALLRYSIGAIQMSKDLLDLAITDIGAILGYPAQIRDANGNLVPANVGKLLNYNCKNLRFICNELGRGGYEHYGKEEWSSEKE